MCISCGDLNHFDNSIIKKAIENKKYGKIKPKEQPRYAISQLYEQDFKQQYQDIVIKEAISEFLDIIKE